MAAKIIKTRKEPKTEQVFGTNGVSYRFVGEEGGPIEIKFDFAQIPPPPFYYYADSLQVNIDRPLRMAVLSFGRRDTNTDKFADRIDVVMPTKSLFGHFWASSRPVEATLNQMLIASGSVGKIKAVHLPDSQAATLFANIIFTVVGDGESTLDFYHLPPREVHLAKTQKKEMQVEPTVRVIMSSALTKYFFDVLRPQADEQNTQVGIERERRAVTSK